MFSVENSKKKHVADAFTGHRVSALTLPAVGPCKVNCSDNFSGVHVRSAVGDTALIPKENSVSGFHRH